MTENTRPLRAPGSHGRRHSDQPLSNVWDDETAREIDRRFSEHIDRISSVERWTAQLSEDMHAMRGAVERIVDAWEEERVERDKKRDGEAKARARTNIMWAGYVALVGAIIVGGGAWFTRSQLAAMERRALAAQELRIDQIAAALPRIPTDPLYRTAKGAPTVDAVQAMMPGGYPQVRRSEITAACLRVEAKVCGR